MTGTLDQPQIVSIKDLLEVNLNIPNYQRPYKWGTRNIQTLLNDIEEAIAEAGKYPQGEYKYRIGTIILHKDKDKDKEGKDIFNIVDGQQRTISFVLICKYLYKHSNEEFKCSILDHEFTNRDSKTNIYYNYAFIKDWFSQKQDKVEVFKNAMDNILEVVTICVDEISEAFQLFDSQNSRGKALDPHHLLKAYHLREMQTSPYEMKLAVNKWEEKSPYKIKVLFANYLFPIWQWSHRKKSRDFTDKEIDIYKGVSEFSSYTFAKRASKAMPCFQLTEPFVAGNDFFEMVDHYLNLLEIIRTELRNNQQLASIYNLVYVPKDKKVSIPKYDELHNLARHNKGYSYARELFECALLCYYDRFHNFDVMAIKKLCKWAFMLRVDREFLGFDSINLYAIGQSPNTSNSKSMFDFINTARNHTEVAALQFNTNAKINGRKLKKLRTELQKHLDNL